MSKSPHRPHQRVVLPNGMWVLIYEDSTMKIAGYERRIRVDEVMSRGNGSTAGAHVFLTIEPTTDPPRPVQQRADDLVTVKRSVHEALQRAVER